MRTPWLRKLVIVASVMCVAPAAARADFSLGPFIGDPTGIDFKFGIAQRSAIDLLIGWYRLYDVEHAGYGYGHLTYLVTPLVARGDAVLVPLRLGIGVAVFGDSNNIDVGARFPLEVALRFRHAPIELYGEIALMLAFVHPVYDFVEVQGGGGVRFYF